MAAKKAAKKAPAKKATTKPTVEQAFKSAMKSSSSVKKSGKPRSSAPLPPSDELDGPISETVYSKTEREYPTAQQLADMRTTDARFKPVKGWRANKVSRTVDTPWAPNWIPGEPGRVTSNPNIIGRRDIPEYKGAGSKENKGSTGRKTPVPSSPGGKREIKAKPKGKTYPRTRKDDNKIIPLKKK